MRFVERTNSSIDQLVQTAWSNLADHVNDFLLITEHDDDPDQLIDESDKLNEEGLPEEERGILDFSKAGRAARMRRPSRPHPPPVIAVDAGVVNIGELAKGGIVFAVRGAACCYTPQGEVIIFRYNTGEIAIDNQNKLKTSHYIGKRLGDEQFFVKVLEEEPYLKEKAGVLSTPNQIQDRFRNFVERIIQAEAVGILKSYGGGILLIDGALPARTFDTPQSYMMSMLDDCDRKNIDVVAISKKTRITIQGIPIQSYLNENYSSDFFGYIPIKEAITEERKNQQGEEASLRTKITLAKEMYAARFSFGPTSLTFRVDLNNCAAKTAEEVINDVYSYCRIYGGYPKPLIEAHQHSCFLFQDVQAITARATVRLGTKPQDQPTMKVLFEPFGSFGK